MDDVNYFWWGDALVFPRGANTNTTDQLEAWDENGNMCYRAVNFPELPPFSLRVIRDQVRRWPGVREFFRKHGRTSARRWEKKMIENMPRHRFDGLDAEQLNEYLGARYCVSLSAYTAWLSASMHQVGGFSRETVLEMGNTSRLYLKEYVKHAKRFAFGPTRVFPEEVVRELDEFRKAYVPWPSDEYEKEIMSMVFMLYWHQL